MNERQAQKAMEETARKFGVPYEVVYREIQTAISEAMKSSGMLAVDFWKSEYVEDHCPSPEEMIIGISNVIGA